jgi:hypothetical protein
MGQFCAVLVWVADRRECFPMTNRFTVSRTGETGVLWLRFQDKIRVQTGRLPTVTRTHR